MKKNLTVKQINKLIEKRIKMKLNEGTIFTDHDVKKIIHKNLKNVKDGAFQNVLRDILFSNKNKINWDLANESLQKNMPELKK